MKINRITFSNLLSYGHKKNIIDFGDRGSLVGITGSNGNGKSSCMDAICYALYGTSFRKINKQQLINRINNRELYTKIEFENNGINWVIERGIQPTFIKIFKNGVEIELDAHAYDIQKFINLNVVGINENVFRTITMVQMRNFRSFFTLPKDKRRELFENAIDISVLSTMRKFFHVKLSDLENEYKVKDVESKYIKSHIDSLEKQLRNIDNVKNNSAEELDSIIKTISYDLKEKRTMFSKNHLVDISKLKDESVDMNNSLLKLKYRGDEYSRQMKKYEKNIEFYMKNDVCFQCKHKLTQKEKEKQLALINKDIEDLKFDIEKDATQYIEIDKKHKEVKEEIESYERDMREIELLESELKKAIDKKNEFLKVSGSDKVRIDIEQQKTDKEQELVELEDEIETYESNIEVADNFKHILGDDGLKRYIYTKFMPILNHHVNEILAKFDFNIKFILGENLDEKIYSRTGDELRIETFSSGEQQLIDVSFMFGLQKFLGGINNYKNESIFIDELLDASIDQENLDKIITFMRELDKNITIITHKSNVKDYFDIAYNIKKEGPFSQIYRDNL